MKSISHISEYMNTLRSSLTTATRAVIHMHEAATDGEA